ncbi:AraC family transcriptional regulator [Konateibacter massiliensis]|uniref:AraC family transcriptional regulator n=1 Tax=Konateibacter massiliensis TaxID=2002841 RepID=UPI000C147493|nr:helix-turn-helix domain-containing protein [Konateibacter massiliensis]
MVNLSVLKDFSEIVHYDDINIPIYVKTGNLSYFPQKKALCHWHGDIEFIKSLKGEMYYYVNGQKFLIREGDALIINSKQLHYGFSNENQDCEFLCVLFKPQLLSGSIGIKNKYIDPIIEHSCIAQQYLNAEITEEAKLIRFFDELAEIYEKKEPGFELHALSRLNLMWLNWFSLVSGKLNTKEYTDNPDVLIQKNMVAFIYDNYKSKITLDEIAQAGGVCRSKCCQIFKNYLKRTPIDFLNTYRLEVSIGLLSGTNLSITEIAFSCGFNNPSYYAEIFLKYKGCSPKNYRLLQIKEIR